MIQIYIFAIIVDSVFKKIVDLTPPPSSSNGSEKMLTTAPPLMLTAAQPPYGGTIWLYLEVQMNTYSSFGISKEMQDRVKIWIK